jgi:outer membrane receptor protein involved in Fe transport
MAEGAMLDLDRVEVLKGPQGTLFGENSTGGAINYIAAKPTEALKAGGDLSYGRFNDVDLQGFISGPIADTVTARLAVRHESADGWQRSLTRPGDTLGDRDFTNGRLLVDWTPSDVVHFELNVSGWHDGSETQASQFEAFTPSQPLRVPQNTSVFAALLNAPKAPDDSRAADWDPNTDYHRDDNFYLTALRGDWTVTDGITLTSITAYSHYTADTPVDADGTAFSNLEINKSGLLTSFSQELRFAGSTGPLKWMIGGNYQNEVANETDTDVFNSTNVFIGPDVFPDGRFIDDQNVETKSVFGSLDYNLTDTLTAQLSARYSKQDRDFRGCFADTGDGRSSAALGLLSTELSGSPTIVAPGRCVTLSSVTFKPLPIVRSTLNQHNVPWQASLSWKPDSEMQIYANITKGYKAGSYSVPAAVLDTQLDPVTQESVLSYEAGFKTFFFDRKVQLSSAAFYYDYRNKQSDGYVLNPIFGPLQQLINIPKSRLYGAELEATVRPSQNWRVAGGVTYLNSKVQANPAAPAEARDPLGQSVTYVGEQFPDTPRWLAVIDAEYSFPITGEIGAFAGGTLTYRDDTNAAFGASPLFKLDGYALLDLRAGVESEDGTWRAELYGRNITDKYYSTNVSRNIDTVARVAGMPATYGISLSYRY